MTISPFLKHALWIAPFGLFLAWKTPRQISISSVSSEKPIENPKWDRGSSIVTPAPGKLSDLSSVAEIQKALTDLEERSDLHPLIAAALRDRALRAWLHLDPASALVHAEENVVHWGESFGKDLFRVWLDLDPDSALESFSLASPALRDSIFKSFFNRFADLDPERVIDLMNGEQWKKAESLFDPRGDVFRHAYGRWAETDPRTAMEHYRENLAHENMVSFSAWPATTIFEAWGKSDPLGAWKYFQGMNEDPNKVDIHGYNMLKIKQTLARFVLTESPELIDEFNPSGSSEQWVDADMQEALGFAESLPKDHLWRAHILVNSAMRLATTDPARALDLFLEGQDSSSERMTGIYPDSFYHENFQMLNARDSGQARELLKIVPEEQRALALGGILAQEFAKDSRSAILEIQEMYQNPDLAEFMDKALSRSIGWTEQNPTEIIAAIPEARSLVKGPLLESWTRKDPEAAAAFLAEEINANPEYQLESDEALSRLASARPELTAQWLHDLPEGKIQNDAVVALAANWSTFDRPAAEEWVATLPDGRLKEIAKKTFAVEGE